jgi:L-alanine-DL-glutamate epimerase-like enolase superfamily enzyme
MRIARIDCLAASAGWRIHDFLKVTASDDLVGWSEFSRAFNGPGVTEAIGALAPELIGKDVDSADVRTLLQRAEHRFTLAYQARAAVANALLDLEARRRGIPVYELLGGAVRDRIRVYWAHCGTYRASHAAQMQKPPLRTIEDMVSLGREVVERGYTAFKTNLLIVENGCAIRYAPRSSMVANRSDRTSPRLVNALIDQLTAFRTGAGPGVDMMVDLGANFGPEAALTMIQAMEPFSPAWVELELGDAAALRSVRSRSAVPIASGERLPASDYSPLLGESAVDVPIVDVLFNGVAQSREVAAVCAEHEVNLAVHNCYSPLATLMAAALCAVTPNLYMLELDVDGVPWQNDFVTCRPVVADGYLSLPSGPGWGAEVDEAAVRAHPVR